MAATAAAWSLPPPSRVHSRCLHFAARAAMDLEEQLAEQLAEQQEALAGVRELLEADPGSQETAALLDELQEGETC